MSLGRLSSSLKEDAYDWGQLLSLSLLASGKSLLCWVSASSSALDSVTAEHMSNYWLEHTHKNTVRMNA